MESSEDNSEFVTVARFQDPAEAQMAKGALEAEGIAVFLQGENANSMMPLTFRARLQVHGSDEAAARSFLESAEAGEIEGEDAL